MKEIRVAAAIVINDGKILIAQKKEGKSNAFLWEFPGGKFEAGESAEDCLKREFAEELDLEIEVGSFYERAEFTYDIGHVLLNVYFASSKTKKVGKMTDHREVLWVSPQELVKYELTPPDKIIADGLLKRLQNSSQFPF